MHISKEAYSEFIVTEAVAAKTVQNLSSVLKNSPQNGIQFLKFQYIQSGLCPCCVATNRYGFTAMNVS